MFFCVKMFNVLDCWTISEFYKPHFNLLQEVFRNTRVISNGRFKLHKSNHFLKLTNHSSLLYYQFPLIVSAFGAKGSSSTSSILAVTTLLIKTFWPILINCWLHSITLNWPILGGNLVSRNLRRFLNVIRIITGSIIIISLDLSYLEYFGKNVIPQIIWSILLTWTQICTLILFCTVLFRILFVLYFLITWFFVLMIKHWITIKFFLALTES